MQRIQNFLAALVCFAAFNANAAHTQAQLILSASSARPGDTVWAGVDLKMESGWHTYWKNPGEAGMATKIEWQLPPGVSVGEIQWPLPEKIPPAEVTTYGYEKEVVLLVPLKIAGDLKPGALDLKAKVSWLECKEVCIPAGTNVEAALDIGDETKTSANAALIESWKSKLPKSRADWSASASWEKPASGDQRPLRIELSGLKKKLSGAEFFPDANENYEIQPGAKSFLGVSGKIELSRSVKKYGGDWPKEIGGVIVLESNGSREGYDVKLPVENSRTGVTPVSNFSGKNMETGKMPVLPSQPPLWKMLLYAFIGGLILNIMPCVLPVIALKILGFVSHARADKRRVHELGLIYAAGVIASFVALAVVVIAVKAAGHNAGWGMQFGNPIFIVCLTTLITLVALNLFGVFEVTLGGRALSIAAELASKRSAAGAFFNGVLATALATPCTAPFLSVALGFAFTQSPSTILLVFVFVGLGLAAPYVVLSRNPALLKFLPPPGAWMEKFKIAMGFPMLATAVWLFNLAADDYGKNVLWLGVFLVMIAFATWIFGEFVQRGRTTAGKGVGLAVALLALIGGYVFALEDQLHWREPMGETDATGLLKESPNGIDWQRWSPEAVAEARAEGRPVLVDFTADWCLTCQVNKRTSIEIPSVREKLKDINAVALVGDYTHFPDAITAELNRYNRAGVPLVLIYPKNPGAQPIVLPEVLTPEIVLNALSGKTMAVSMEKYILTAVGILVAVAGILFYLRRRSGRAGH